MAKQKKQLLVLLILLVVCLLAFLCIRLYTKNAKEEDSESAAAAEIVVAKLDPEAVDAFSYDLDGTVYAFTKSGDAWTCDSDTGRELDADQIDTMLEKLERVTAEEKLDESDSLSEYGLDASQRTITVGIGSETTTFLIGDYNDMLGQYYLKLADEDAVYLVDSTLYNAFSKTVDDLVVEEETEETTE